MRSASQIIEDMGGEVKVLLLFEDDNEPKPGYHAVYRWRNHGIPDKYWPKLIATGETNADELLAANEAIRNGKT